jgi:Effector protein
VADFSHQPEPLQQQPSHERIRTEEDLTHQVHGPLGTMSVVPDNYVGPMPNGAVRQSDYHRMTSVYGNIASGQSQVQFDTSSFFKTGAEKDKDLSLFDDPMAYLKAMGEAAQFKQQYMGYMQDLVKTPAGLQMLETLDQSKTATKIERADPGNGNATKADESADSLVQPDGSHGKGTSSQIWADPTAKEWDAESCHGVQPWMADRPRFGFYHELVHAYHNSRGDAAVSEHGRGQTLCSDPHDIPWPIVQTEWQTAGLGPYAGGQVSENAIRAQMGVPPRPTYSGGTYEDWNQQTDAEEPPRHSPRR